jgi:hypothetical protein
MVKRHTSSVTTLSYSFRESIIMMNQVGYNNVSFKVPVIAIPAACGGAETSHIGGGRHRYDRVSRKGYDIEFTYKRKAVLRKRQRSGVSVPSTNDQMLGRADRNTGKQNASTAMSGFPPQSATNDCCEGRRRSRRRLEGGQTTSSLAARK